MSTTFDDVRGCEHCGHPRLEVTPAQADGPHRVRLRCAGCHAPVAAGEPGSVTSDAYRAACRRLAATAVLAALHDRPRPGAGDLTVETAKAFVKVSGTGVLSADALVLDLADPLLEDRLHEDLMAVRPTLGPVERAGLLAEVDGLLLADGPMTDVQRRVHDRIAADLGVDEPRGA